MHYRARSMDPRTGRFLSKDPLVSNSCLKPYSYATNNPASKIDPLGLFEWDEMYGIFKERYGKTGEDLEKEVKKLGYKWDGDESADVNRPAWGLNDAWEVKEKTIRIDAVRNSIAADYYFSAMTSITAFKDHGATQHHRVDLRQAVIQRQATAIINDIKELDGVSRFSKIAGLIFDIDGGDEATFKADMATFFFPEGAYGSSFVRPRETKDTGNLRIGGGSLGGRFKYNGADTWRHIAGGLIIVGVVTRFQDASDIVQETFESSKRRMEATSELNGTALGRKLRSKVGNGDFLKGKEVREWLDSQLRADFK